jgi:hypothetical protein
MPRPRSLVKGLIAPLFPWLALEVHCIAAPPPWPVAFYPPTPPVSGAVIAEQVRVTAGPVQRTAPDQLADYVGENFYGPLGTRLFAHDLSGTLKKRLEAYHADRAALVTELQNEIVRVQNMAAADQQQALQHLAEKQARPLAHLEDAAESLRHLFTEGGWMDGSLDFNAARPRTSVHVTGPAGAATRIAALMEFQALQGARFYQDGLSPEQRDLLAEITLEIQQQTQPPSRRPDRKDDPANAFFFSPGGARFFLPENLPPELNGKIRDYERAKFEEKKMLRETLAALDREEDYIRTKELGKLADSQAPRLARMEELAEEVRRGLAQLPAAPPPLLPPKLPPKQLERIENYRRDLQALMMEQMHYVMSHRTPFSSRRAPPPANREAFQQRIAEVNAAAERTLRDFRAQNADRFGALRAEREAILKDADEFARLNTDPATGQPMNVAGLFAYMKAADDYFARVGRDEAMYADYNRAMLLPGLSPAQRRLLFHTALAGLAQPLPDGMDFNRTYLGLIR